MLIENRHKKPYSEKLFNELCIVYLLIDNDNSLDYYVLDRLFQTSKRTLYRYIKDINDVCPSLGLHSEGENKHKYLCASLPKQYDDYDLYQYILDLGKDNSNCSDRLWRCTQLLAKNYGCLDKEDCIDESDLINISAYDKAIINNERYAFIDFSACDELYGKTSLRTQQRDVKLVKTILIKMKQIE